MISTARNPAAMATCLKEGRHTLAVSEVTSKCLSYSLPPRPPPFTGKAPL